MLHAEFRKKLYFFLLGNLIALLVFTQEVARNSSISVDHFQVAHIVENGKHFLTLKVSGVTQKKLKYVHASKIVFSNGKEKQELRFGFNHGIADYKKKVDDNGNYEFFIKRKFKGKFPSGIYTVQGVGFAFDDQTATSFDSIGTSEKIDNPNGIKFLPKITDFTVKRRTKNNYSFRALVHSEERPIFITAQLDDPNTGYRASFIDELSSRNVVPMSAGRPGSWVFSGNFKIEDDLLPKDADEKDYKLDLQINAGEMKIVADKEMKPTVTAEREGKGKTAHFDYYQSPDQQRTPKIFKRKKSAGMRALRSIY